MWRRKLKKQGEKSLRLLSFPWLGLRNWGFSEIALCAPIGPVGRVVMAAAFATHPAISPVHHQCAAFVVRNPKAGDGVMVARVYLLQRSQMFGEGPIGPSQLSPHLPENELVARSRKWSLRRSRSWGCCPCAIVDPALRSRSSSFVSQDLRRGRTDRWMVRCVGPQAAAGGVAWKPILDQVLLLGTVFGVYVAGVASVPRLPQLFPDRGPSSARQDTTTSQKSAKANPIRKQNPKPQSPESSSGEDVWSSLRSKLCQAVPMETAEGEEEEGKVVKSPMLGLQAIARVPRLQLLLMTLQHLRKEVEAITDDEQDLGLIQWQELSLSVLSRSVPPVCRDWLSQESWRTTDPPESVSDDAGNLDHVEVDALENMMSILKESESIPSYLIRSGKAGLYADLIFFLRFGSARVGGCCDHRVFKKYTGSVLEDVVVAVAEVVATLLLDCSSLASLSPHGEMWQTFFLPSILSSRSLERFRNEVALYGWLNQNFASVAAMFEDRFDLWTLQKRRIPSAGQKQEKSPARKQAKKVVKVGSDDLVLTRSQLPARRSTELKALTGWRYYYSLLLELSDVAGPLMSILLSKVGDVVSFLLITLIGRSLGLVCQGIRQSVGWPTNQKKDKQAL